MAKPNPPKIGPDQIPKTPDDEFGRFITQLYFRLSNGVEEIEKEKLNRAWVSFEALGAILPLLDEGMTHDEIKTAYPSESWREETVEFPVALLREICLGWLEFSKSETKTLGQAYGFEAFSRQGKRPMKKVAAAIGRKAKLAAEVENRYRQIGEEPARSLASVVGEVAQIFKVSEGTVENAYSEYRGQIERNLGLVTERFSIPPKTS